MKTSTDYLIIGAGPAGLQLGYFLERAGHDYVILERGTRPGTFFQTFPRHRTLLSINKVFTGFQDREVNLRWDWNSLLGDDDAPLFKSYSRKYYPHADELLRYLADFAAHHRLRVKYGVDIVQIDRESVFEARDREGNVWTAPRLIIATGMSRPFLPEIPGIEQADQYGDVSLDPDEFEGQRVLIIGKSNSAFETANHLLAAASTIHLVSPNPLTMAWKSKFVGNVRGINDHFLDTYQLKLQNALLDADVSRIERTSAGKFAVTVHYRHANSEVEELLYDRVICCAGFRFDATIFSAACRPKLTIRDRFPEQTAWYESSSVKNLYFAGTLMQMRDFKKKQSSFIHGFRYNVSALFRILERRYHGVDWPRRSLSDSPEVLTRAVIQRVNQSSALWQQTGYICDLLVQPGPGAGYHYYEDVPVDLVHDPEFNRGRNCYVITLEFGASGGGDPLSQERVHKEDAERAHESAFIHPVLRHFIDGELVESHHVIEDLEGIWIEDVHCRPLLRFFERARQLHAPELATFSEI